MTAPAAIAFPKIGEGGPPGFPEASVVELWGFAMAVDEDELSVTEPQRDRVTLAF